MRRAALKVARGMCGLVRVGKDLIETVTRCLAVDHFHISASTSCSKWWSSSAQRRKRWNWMCSLEMPVAEDK